MHRLNHAAVLVSRIGMDIGQNLKKKRAMEPQDTAPILVPPTRNRTRTQTEQRLDQLFVLLTRTCAAGIWVLLIAIAVAILLQAIPAMQAFGWRFLITRSWNPVTGREIYGALPMIYGTLVSSAISLSLAVPLGLGTAIFLSEDFLPVPLRDLLVFFSGIAGGHPQCDLWVVGHLCRDSNHQRRGQLALWSPRLVAMV